MPSCSAWLVIVVHDEEREGELYIDFVRCSHCEALIVLRLVSLCFVSHFTFSYTPGHGAGRIVLKAWEINICIHILYNIQPP